MSYVSTVSLTKFEISRSAAPAYYGQTLHGCQPFMGTLKPQSNEYTVIGTLAVDGWAVTFGTARRGRGSSLCTCNSPPISGQCANVISFDVALWLPLHSKGSTEFEISLSSSCHDHPRNWLNIQCCVLKNAPPLACCSFDKYKLILLIFG